MNRNSSQHLAKCRGRWDTGGQPEDPASSSRLPPQLRVNGTGPGPLGAWPLVTLSAHTCQPGPMPDRGGNTASFSSHSYNLHLMTLKYQDEATNSWKTSADTKRA